MKLRLLDILCTSIIVILSLFLISISAGITGQFLFDGIPDLIDLFTSTRYNLFVKLILIPMFAVLIIGFPILIVTIVISIIRYVSYQMIVDIWKTEK